MGKKPDYSEKIKEIEEELSDEKIAELFQVFDEEVVMEAARARRKKRMTARQLIVVLIIVLGVVVALQFFSVRVVGERSMEDTIMLRDSLVLAITAYDVSEVQAEDIVMIETYMLDGFGNARDMIKRVIGLPGDVIEIRDGCVYRNGILLDEPYIRDRGTDGHISPVQVPEGSFFVMGDNRRISIDSRDERIGFVTQEQIIGKVVFRLMPFSRMGPIA